MNTGAFIEGLSTTFRPDQLVKNKQDRDDKRRREALEQEDRTIRRTEAEASKARQERYDAERDEDRTARADEKTAEAKLNQDIALIQAGGEAGAETLTATMNDLFAKAAEKNPKVKNPLAPENPITFDNATQTYVIRDATGNTKKMTLAAAEDFYSRASGKRNPGESMGRTAAINGAEKISDDSIKAWESKYLDQDKLGEMEKNDPSGFRRNMEYARARISRGESPAAAYSAMGLPVVNIGEEDLRKDIEERKAELARIRQDAESPDSDGGTTVTDSEREAINTAREEAIGGVQAGNTKVQKARAAIPGVNEVQFNGTPTTSQPASGTITIQDPSTKQTYRVKASAAQKYLDAGYLQVDN